MAFLEKEEVPEGEVHKRQGGKGAVFVEGFAKSADFSAEKARNDKAVRRHGRWERFDTEKDLRDMPKDE